MYAPASMTGCYRTEPSHSHGSSRSAGRFLAGALLCMSLTLTLGACASRPAIPRAVDGVLDLRAWDLAADGPVRLDGDWDIYPGRLLSAQELDDPEIAATSGRIHVPGAWNARSYADGPMQAEGVATYALRLRFDPSTELPAYLAIRIPTPMNTAYALYVDGELVGKAGTVGLDRAGTTPQYAPNTALFAPQRDGAALVLQMANFDHAFGGPIESLVLGSRVQIEAQQARQSGRNAFLIGSLCIMGLYHLGIFGLRRREKAALYFGLFCLVAAAAVLTFQYPALFTLYISESWSLFLRTSLCLAATSMLPLTAFTHKLFPQEASSLGLRVTAVATLIFVLNLLLLPIQIVTALILPVVIFLLTVLGYTLAIVAQAAARGRSGARILLVAHLPLIAAIVNDGLFFTGRLQTEQMASVGILCLVFAQAYLLSVRFSNAFNQTEILTDELRRSEEKYRTIFEDSRDLILTTSGAGTIDAVNAAGMGLLGYAPVELLARPLVSLFIRPAEGEALLTALAETGSVTEFAADLRHRDGHSVPCGITASRRGEDTRLMSGYQAIVHDMTAYRQAEAERERTLLLEKAMESAEAASRAKSDFLATMSHELRTPLNSILGYAQILQDQTRLSAFQRRSVHTILANGRHLLNLIQDILDFSRIEADRLAIVYADVALYPLMAEVVGAVQVKAQEKKLGLSWQIQPDLPSHIQTDEKRLRQILLNLLSNAVHYTEQGKVALAVSYLDGGRDAPVRIRFEVSDTGIGLTRQEMARIFEPFEQAVGPDSRNQGLGLGLSISQRLAGLLGGTIQVESNPGQGSRFWLDLPCDCAVEERLPGETVTLAWVTSSIATAEALMIPLPSETLDQLYQLAQLGDMVGVEAAAQDLAMANPRYEPFAQQVTSLAREFKDRAICALIDACREERAVPSQAPPPSTA